MAQKQVLGRGLGAILGNNARPHVENKSNSQAAPKSSNPNIVDIDLIFRNKTQPRKKFDEKDLNELADSIREQGLISPIVVRKVDNKYEIIAGERRWRACKLINLKKVPVVIRENVTDKDMQIMAIIENVQRADLNCVEVALGYSDLIKNYNLTQEQVAKSMGKERSSVANFLRILALPRDVQELLVKDTLSFGHAKVLAAVKDQTKCSRLALQAADKNLSVRELEKLIKSGAKKPQDKEDNPLTKQLDDLKNNLEKRTGFHFKLTAKKNGSGEIILKYNNQAEFNDLYDYFLNK